MPNSGTARAIAAAALTLCAPLLLGSVGLTSNLETRLLAAHNRERAALGIPRLNWNPKLEASARAWANHLGRTGRFEHSPDNPHASPEGENLWAGTQGYYGPEAMVGLWAAEKRHFKPGRFPNNSRTGNVDSVGHYTQLMWRNTRSVGCALAKNRSEDVLVCRYSTAGNVYGQVPF